MAKFKIQRSRKKNGSVLRTRKHISSLGVNRLTVHRTPRHIRAQVISPDNIVLASASTLEKAIASELSYTGNAASAAKIGEVLAKRCQEKSISQVAFDRSGFKYHGRVKALADAARAGGLDF